MNTVLSQSDLILYSIYRITRRKDECTFERLVYETFTLFPEKFSFYTYKLPDSLKLDRQLRTMRKDKLIIGNNTYGFSLTKLGEHQAVQIENILPNSNVKRLSNQSGTGRKEQQLIERILNSNIYKRYKHLLKLSILDLDELKILFLGTVETPKKDMLENMLYFQKIAVKARKKDVVEFINECKSFVIKSAKK